MKGMIVMDNRNTTTATLDQAVADEEILTSYTVSDEALEAAASMGGAVLSVLTLPGWPGCPWHGGSF